MTTNGIHNPNRTCLDCRTSMHADIRDQATHVNEITIIVADSAVLEAEAGRPLHAPTEI